MGAMTALMLLAAVPPLDRILERLSEEAEVFAQKAPYVVARERLLHRGRLSPPRFRPRVGAKATQMPLAYVQREVLSEYGWGPAPGNPADLREFRQVVAVDGKQIKKPEKARLALAMNMASDDDRERKRMLQDFERYGMIGAATDFAQDIVLFRRRSLPNYRFAIKGSGDAGGQAATIVGFQQARGQDGARVYHGNQLERVGLEGEIWIRERDLLPLRIVIFIATVENRVKILHTGQVDYFQSTHGVLLPSQVLYRKTEGENLLVENHASYDSYRMFRVETEIKFTPEETVPAPARP
jgi:hypothetical protein